MSPLGFQRLDYWRPAGSSTSGCPDGRLPVSSESEMPRAPVNGIELYYQVHGQGPAVVFAHGAGGNHMSWWQQVPAFARHCRCVTFDHRGFGFSGDGVDGPGPTAFVDDLRGLLDYLDIEQAFLVGQSMAGWTCMGFALAHPQRVRALVMANTLAGIRRAVWQPGRGPGPAHPGGRAAPAGPGTRCGEGCHP